MPRQRDRRADGCSKGEAAVGGEVTDVQHGITEEQGQHRQGTDQAQFQRGLTKGQDQVHVKASLNQPSRSLNASAVVIFCTLVQSGAKTDSISS